MHPLPPYRTRHSVSVPSVRRSTVVPSKTSRLRRMRYIRPSMSRGKGLMRMPTKERNTRIQKQVLLDGCLARRSLL